MNTSEQCAGCGQPVDTARLLCKRCEDEATSVSTKQFYLHMIARPEVDTRFLNSLREDVKADDTLHGPEKDELFTAINNRQAAINALPEWQLEGGIWKGPAKANALEKLKLKSKGCKHLIALLLLASLMSFSSLAFAQGRGQLVPDCFTNLMGRRLAALSMIESGDNDMAIGAANEVSRYQIMPSVFAKYFFVVRPPPGVAAIRLRLASRNAFTARNIARSIMQDRCRAFETQFHRPPNDMEVYILWARPGWYFNRHTTLRDMKDFEIVAQRAVRFSNLVNR